MANVEHNALTDPELHEPKGIAAASANHVYVADGAASGVMTQITPANAVVIHSASDLPTAVAGVRTLAASTTYIFSGSVDIGSDRLVLGASTGLFGSSPLLDGIVSTTTGALITSAASFFIGNLFVTCSSGSVFDLNGTSVEVALVDKLRITSCDTAGVIDAWGTLTLSEMLIQGATTSGYTFTGANGNIRINQGTFVVAAGIVFDLGTATADGFVFNGCNIDNASGVTGIDIAASGANINTGGQGIIDSCSFLTPASATAGYAAGDVKWTMSGSVGVPRSTAVAQGNIVDSALTTTFAGIGAGNEVIVNFGTAWVADVSRRFTISNAGRFTYTGDIDIEVMAQSSIYASIGGGATRVYNFYIAKNGTIIDSSASQRDYDGTNSGSSATQSVVSLSTNDYIELYVRAETATTALTADTVSTSIIQVSN
jgi:hypothetical protein